MALNEFTGNSIPAPTYNEVGYTVNEELLYSHDHNYIQKGVTLKPGQGVLKLGTFLARDAATKMYVKTTTPGDVLGVLRKTTDTGTDANGQVWLANILYGGVLKLAPVSEANSGVTLTSVLNAKVNTVEGFFKF